MNNYSEEFSQEVLSDEGIQYDNNEVAEELLRYLWEN